MMKIIKVMLCLVACSLPYNVSVAADLPQLKIGVVLPLSGPQSTAGFDAASGLDIALEDLKQQDPQLAKRLTIIKEDEKSSPVDAATAVQKLINIDKVNIIYGTVASSNTLAMSAAVNKAGIPLVTPASTNPEITKKSDLFFRTCFIDPFQGSALASFALNHLKKKTAAILLDHKSDYSRGLAEAFTKSFKDGGGQIVANEAYEAGKKEFKVQLAKIREKKPDILFVPGYYQEAGLILRQAKQIGYQVTILGGDGWDSPSLFEIAGPEAAAGHYFLTNFSSEENQESIKKFGAAYEQRHKKKPGGVVALGYDGMIVIADAFKRAGSNQPEALKKALANTKNLQSISGKISINTMRDAEKDAVILQTEKDSTKFIGKILKDGQFVKK